MAYQNSGHGYRNVYDHTTNGDNNMIKVTYWNYGKYSNSNYGAHSLAFKDVDGNNFFFSYETLVAFTHKDKFYVSENRWGPTTGKHLNWIDNGNKSLRLARDKFVQAYEDCFNKKLEEVA